MIVVSMQKGTFRDKATDDGLSLKINVIFVPGLKLECGRNPAHTPGRHISKDGVYQNMDDFLRFLVIHRDSIHLLQFISNMNKSFHTQNTNVNFLKYCLVFFS